MAGALTEIIEDLAAQLDFPGQCRAVKAELRKFGQEAENFRRASIERGQELRETLERKREDAVSLAILAHHVAELATGHVLHPGGRKGAKLTREQMIDRAKQACRRTGITVPGETA